MKYIGTVTYENGDTEEFVGWEHVSVSDVFITFVWEDGKGVSISSDLVDRIESQSMEKPQAIGLN